MKIYYIDDSFFTHSEFARQMAYKLEVLLRENEINYLLISVSKNTEKEIKRFEERLKEFKPHLDCLFSGKSGWAFPIRNIEGKQEYDVSKAYPSLSRFYKDNKELNFNSFSKYKHV